MNTEILKKLAEALGYELATLEVKDMVHVKGKDGYGIWIFDPENNAEQREEILLWLMRRGIRICYSEFDHAYEFVKGDNLLSLNKDYTTALLNAAEKEINQ